MSRIETTVVIDRPVDDVWLFLCDPRNVGAWCPDADEITPLSDGPLAKGSRFIVSGRIGPLRSRSTQQVIAFEPYRAIELRSVDGVIGGSVVTGVELETDGARTILRGTSDKQGLPRWLAILSPSGQDRDAFFATLKRSIDAQAPEPILRDPESELLTDPQLLGKHASIADDLVAPAAAGDTHRIDTEPTTDAEEPLAEAEERVAEVEEPVAEVEEPIAQPDEPETLAEEPVPEREAPIAQLDEPAAQVEEPIAEAEEPVAQVEAPVADAGPAETPHAPTTDEERLTLRLETERGPAPTFEIPRSGATIGRAPESTVRLDDLSVSRRHARISYRNGGYWLSDLKSASGTWVDEKKLSAPRRLAPDQIVRVGILRLRVVVGAAGDEMPAHGDTTPRPSELAGPGRRRR